MSQNACFRFLECFIWMLASDIQQLLALDVRKEIPIVRNCADINHYYGKSPNGEYCIAANKGGEEYYLRIYCHNMDKRCPEEWISLPSGSERNKAETFLPSPYDPVDKKLGSVLFGKLRLDIKTVSVMIFDSVGFGLENYTYVDERARTIQPFFYPSVMANFLCYYKPCICPERCFGPDEISLNLQCTPFSIPNNIEIGTIQDGCITANEMLHQRQVLRASCGINTANSCGGCGPRYVGDLQTINEKDNGDRLMPLDVNPDMDGNICSREQVGDPLSTIILGSTGECTRNTTLEPISCGKLPSIPVTNGDWGYFWCSQREFFHPRKCQVVCKDGFRLSGKMDTVMCANTGQVEPPISSLARCEPLENACESNPCPYGLCDSFPGGFRCICPSGKTGPKCKEDVRECFSNPCIEGKCVDGLNSYECFCTPGFFGINCEKEVDECHSQPCENGGECLDGINTFECVCVTGFAGLYCEANLDDCAAEPCRAGQCLDKVNSFQCVCPAGFTGSICDVELNECSSTPCENGYCEDLKNGFHCVCFEGFMGDRCEKEIDECLSNPCIHGACKDDVAGYECKCRESYRGIHCNEKTKLCEQHSCVNGKCVDEGESYRCRCDAGYRGKFCEINLDECESMPCAHGMCIDLPNGFKCVCQCGFTDILCDLPTQEEKSLKRKLQTAKIEQDCDVEDCARCVKKHKDICESCKTGLDLVGGKCFGVCRDAHCASCPNTVDDNSCIICDAGYALSWTGECIVQETEIRSLLMSSASLQRTALSFYLIRILVFSLTS